VIAWIFVELNANVFVHLRPHDQCWWLIAG
jgi:hypothetical protein